MSPFPASVRRASTQTARQRNDLVAVLARAVFAAHAEPGGETARVAELARDWGKPVLGFEDGKTIPELVDQIRTTLETSMQMGRDDNDRA